jgi:drug/metabolite transporter (DMT)-like permease
MVADPAIWIALLANFLAGVVRIFVKKLNQTDSPGQMLLFVHLTAFAIMAVGAFSYWHTPSFDQMITLFGMGVAGTFSQYSYIRALQYSDPSAVAPFEYSRLVIAMPVGMILFEEFPTIVSVIGSLIIIGSNFLMTLISVKNSKKKIPSEI